MDDTLIDYLIDETLEFVTNLTSNISEESFDIFIEKLKESL